MKKENFDFEAYQRDAKDKLRSGAPLTGKDGVITPLLKHFLETLLDEEMKTYMNEPQRHEGNRRNGKTSKTVKSLNGQFELETPRDRSGTFDPQIVGKRQIVLGPDLEHKVMIMYGKGMSYRDICDEIQQMYGTELSAQLLSNITDRIIPEMNNWRERPLESTYPFIWLDAMFYKVRVDGRVQKRALYFVIGVNPSGIKDLMGIYVCETESAHFWMSVMDDLKRRGVEDVLIACIDHLTGFNQAVEASFPKADVQSCIIHQIRNSKRYIANKDIKEVMVDLKTIYKANNREIAERNLAALEQKWGKKYVAVVKSWQNNWPNLSTMFNYSDNIRKVIYTTNIIESFNRQIRKVTKNKGAFNSDISLMKLVYLATKDIQRRARQKTIPNWGLVASELKITFGDRAKIDIRN